MYRLIMSINGMRSRAVPRTTDIWYPAPTFGDIEQNEKYEHKHSTSFETSTPLALCHPGVL